jgi:hypothetical protein
MLPLMPIRQKPRSGHSHHCSRSGADDFIRNRQVHGMVNGTKTEALTVWYGPPPNLRELRRAEFVVSNLHRS